MPKKPAASIIIRNAKKKRKKNRKKGHMLGKRRGNTRKEGRKKSALIFYFVLFYKGERGRKEKESVRFALTSNVLVKRKGGRIRQREALQG